MTRASLKMCWPLTALCALLAAQPASAITFEQLAADGSGTGLFYTPGTSDWVLAPTADETRLSGSGSNWLIDMGTDNFGSGEDGTQTSGIFGAGLVLPGSDHGWRIDFSANLRTWDSYNDGSIVPPNPGAQLGDWDLFSVNANQQNFYWNLVTTPDQFSGGEIPSVINDGEALFAATSVAPAGIGSSGLLTDPLVPVRPAGTIVQYTNTTNDTAYLPGSTWAWGGRDYAAGYFESVSTNGSVISRHTGATFVSFVLDSRTPSYSDNSLPSWGQFGAKDQFTDIPDGSEGEAPGGSFANPVLPIDESEDGTFIFSVINIEEGAPGLDGFLFIDPEVTVGYEYQVGGDVAVTEILLPLLGDLDGYNVELLLDGQWTVVGSVLDGGSFTFEDAVKGFRVTGISPALGLNPENPVAFITGLKFNQPGQAELSMTSITAEVPEPTTWALALSSLLLVGVLRARRRR